MYKLKRATFGGGERKKEEEGRERRESVKFMGRV